MSFRIKLSDFNLYFKKIGRFFASKKGIKISIIVLILIIILIRACSFNDKKKTTFNIGRDNRRYWVNLMGKERSVGAFSDELLSLIGKEQHLKFNIYSIPFEEALNRLRNGEVDGILSSLQPEKISKDLVYSDAYFLLGPVLVVSKETELNHLKGSHRKIIGISTQAATALEITKDASSVQLHLYDNDLRALADLNDNQIDGVILPALVAYTYIKTFYSKQLKVATEPLTAEGLRLIAVKNEIGEELIEMFNEGLKELKKDGTYDRLINNWGLVNTSKLEGVGFLQTLESPDVGLVVYSSGK